MNYAQVVDEIFSQAEGVNFGIKLWDGIAFEYGNPEKKAFTMVIEDEWTAKRLLSQGALGFGESYMDGTLRIEGDFEAYMRLRHRFRRIKPSVRLAVASYLAKRAIPKHPKDQIAYHYDMGNELFELFLDKETMSYSCGVYVTGKEPLAVAQRKKLKLVCDWLDLPKGAQVLDLGCGWGGFATYAAEKRDWKITGCSLSREQLAYCKKQVGKKSLQKQIALKYLDMLVELPAKKYDAIVLLESIEHVGKPRLDAFITKLYEHLKPGGVVYIQTTGKYVPKMPDSWTLKYVFPGGYLPTKKQLLVASEQAGFEVEKFVDDSDSYIQTLTEWVCRIEANKAEIEQLFDERFYRMWELWTRGAKVSYEVGSINLFRMKLRKPE